MHSTTYYLHPRSAGWMPHHNAQLPYDWRLARFDLKVRCHGHWLGGNNIQVVIGEPEQPRYGLDEDVAMWLASGWWVTLRNQFAHAPDVAVKILITVAGELSGATAEATAFRGAEREELWGNLLPTTLEATGPDYWI